ncbi:hypothetical protein [Pseudomonas atacamensis]|uniref:hypothetical protein n=1 Tax=Pseudomonas atacamensis TaxID=2565368 RepID=UPI002B46A6CE|nr:hypothetical protein [Pseudomonas atacamensis]MEB2854069.1 hypothetical protein [Pseudomonas atacamensis]
MAVPEDLEKAVVSQIIDYLKSTPQVLFLVIMAIASGHLWAFIITSFFKEKENGNKELRSIVGRLSLGLMWLAANLVVIYGLEHHSLPRDYSKIIELIFPTIILGLFLQLIVYVLVIAFGERP